MVEQSDTVADTSLLSLPKRELLERIDGLAISADAKALLSDIAAATIEVGGKLIALGRQVLAFVFDLVKRFPNTAFGVLVAFVISALIASIPVVGAILGPLLSPLLLAFGIGAGALADLNGGAIGARVRRFEAQLSSAVSQA